MFADIYFLLIHFRVIRLYSHLFKMYSYSLCKYKCTHSYKHLKLDANYRRCCLQGRLLACIAILVKGKSLSRYTKT